VETRDEDFKLVAVEEFALISLSDARLLFGDSVLSIRCFWVALVARVGASAGGSCDCVAPFRRKCDHSLGWPLGLWVFF
jgi:hypothetical protein